MHPDCLQGLTLVSERKPIEPLTEKQREHYLKLPGLIILGRAPGVNAWHGYVEHSMSMGWDADHVNYWWSGTGTDAIFGFTMTIDAQRDVDSHMETIKKNKPDWEIKVFDVFDPDLPVVLDREAWMQANRYDPNKLSGVSDKFKARNIPFKMKE